MGSPAFGRRSGEGRILRDDANPFAEYGDDLEVFTDLVKARGAADVLADRGHSGVMTAWNRAGRPSHIVSLHSPDGSSVGFLRLDGSVR